MRQPAFIALDQTAQYKKLGKGLKSLMRARTLLSVSYVRLKK